MKRVSCQTGYVLYEFLSFLVTLQSQVIHILCQPNQGSLEEPAMLLTLLNKVSGTQSEFGIGCAEPLVALLHRWRDIGRLASLVST